MNPENQFAAETAIADSLESNFWTCPTDKNFWFNFDVSKLSDHDLMNINVAIFSKQNIKALLKKCKDQATIVKPTKKQKEQQSAQDDM
jgi:hypothetical protein